MSNATPTDPPLIAAPKSRGKLYAIIAAAIVVVIAAVFAIVSITGTTTNASTGAGASVGGSSGSVVAKGPGSPEDPVRIGVVGASDPYWSEYVDAASEAGISVELVDFSEYNQPNPAVAEGDLDLNQFQHSVYLAQYNVASEKDLVPIGATAIYPLGLFSTEYESVDDIKKGDIVAVPNDPANLARALLVLEASGLIELDSGGNIFSGLDDIDTEASLVTVSALEASLTATSLPDVAAAIINNDFVDDAGLTAGDAIAQDDPSDPNAAPYINIFAARPDDADNEVFLELVDIFQGSDAVIDGLIENSGDSAIPVKTPVEDLRKTLTRVEADTEANAG